MKLTTTVCFALCVALCYLYTASASPIQTVDEAKEQSKAVGRQSGPVVSPGAGQIDPDDEDDDDDDDDDELDDLDLDDDDG